MQGAATPVIAYPKTIHFVLSSSRSQAVWVIDQACSVKMARYWPSSFFACLWTEMESRSIDTQKKYEANIKPS